MTKVIEPIDTLEKAKKMASQIQSNDIYAKTLNALGFIKGKKGSVQEGIDLILEGYKIVLSLQKPKSLLIFIQNLIDLYEIKKDYTSILKYLDETIDLAENYFPPATKERFSKDKTRFTTIMQNNQSR